MVKKVPPYLRHTKPPYTIHPYSAVLAARTDMVAWYTAPKIVRIEPIIEIPDIDFAPESRLTDEQFRVMVEEQRRVERMKEAAIGSGPIEANKVRKVEYDLEEPVVLDTEGSGLSEADFDLIKEPVKEEGPTSPLPHEEPTVSIEAPVEGTPAGNAAKRHGKATRPKAAIDTFPNVTPPEAKKASGLFGGRPTADPFSKGNR